MSLETLAGHVAALPERAVDTLGALRRRTPPARRTPSAGWAFALFGFGLATGIAIGLLLEVVPAWEEPDPSDEGDEVE